MSIMTGMEHGKPRPRRSFTTELNADIVERCRRRDRSIGQVAGDFDLTETRSGLCSASASKASARMASG
jgi:transposase